MKSPFRRNITFLHTGHIGDIIAFLPIYYALGGTKILVCDSDWMQPMSGYKYNSLKPLLESQGIEVNLNENTPCIDHDMTNWRECYDDHVSLLDAQARFLNIVDRRKGRMKIDKPWIKVEADPLTKGRVIFNKTPRYPNPLFPWEKVRKHFGDRALFVGTESEHEDFCNRYGSVEYYKTDSCLDVAKAIQGADYFVGNQSSSFWIAAALHKPLLQEVFTPAPNSIIKYDGATYSHDGIINFDKLEK